MDADAHAATTLDREKNVLRALCQGTLEGSVRERARRHLANYVWSDALHEVIFEIVMSLPIDSPEVIREQLPARLTRRGFPDADLDALFRGPLLSRAEAERVIRSLHGP